MITWITAAQKALAEMNAAEPLRQRIYMALEFASQLQVQLEQCQQAKARLDVQLESAQADAHDKQEQLQALKALHAEDIRVHSAVEFRRGVRTGGQWLPFCPKCHMPAINIIRKLGCSDHGCEWEADISLHDCAGIINDLG